MFTGVDLSSDTATQPTLKMKQAMMEAPLGDEQKEEDPTTEALQKTVAELLGFEKSLFFPSATMANQVAIALLCNPGDVLIAAENCHLFTAEAGGPAIHSGVMTRPIQTKTGIFTAEDLLNACAGKRTGRHYPVSTCISIENTTNLGGGLAWDLETLSSVLRMAEELKLKTHLDGSRLFNAAIKLGVKPKELTFGFDTVTICLSKGLGCPIGAVLSFPTIYFEKAMRLKHLFGGALRQSGILTAAGLYAIKYNISRLAEDHALATVFAHRLKAEIPQIEVEFHPQSTNMVFFSWNGKQLLPDQFYEKCFEKGIRLSRVSANRFRAVFHLGINSQMLSCVVDDIKEVSFLYENTASIRASL